MLTGAFDALQEQKKLAEDMIVEEDTVAGLELVDTKVFK